MSQKSKANRKSKQKRRVNLQRFEGECVKVTGEIVDFGRVQKFGVPLGGRATILLRELEINRNIKIHHLWLECSQALVSKLGKGMVIAFEGRVVRYESERLFRTRETQTIYKYGLKIENENEIKVQM